MLHWLTENLATILVGLLLAAGVAGVIVLLRRDKKRGRSACGCNCGSCPMGGVCHKR